ncbi:MAG TPA: TerB family tellurite resistance protein [Bacteroidota bacterium]|nr:TerB family tellurite resistance protein [Bacteroidota bacterium]
MPVIAQDRDAQKKIISEYLKAADRFIKSSEFPRALDEVNKALGVEPNNMYALAYNERVKVAIEAAKKKEEEERLRKLAEEQKKGPPPPKAPEPAAKAANAPDAKPLPTQAPPSQPSSPAPLPGDDLVAKIKKDSQESAEKKADARLDLLKQEFTTSQQKYQDDIARLAAEAKNAIAAKEAAETKLAAMSSNAAGAPPSGMLVALLTKLFTAAWADGTISDDERALLTVLKDQAGLSDEEFRKIEGESGASSYIVNLREVWKDGVVTPEEAEKLEALRKILKISAEEHFRLEAQIRKEMQSKK